MRVWITGGTGSLGSKVLSEFLDCFPNAKILAPNRKELDLLDEQDVKKFVKDFRPTHIVHLAAKVFGIQGHINFPMESIIQNTQMDLSIFGAINETPPEWFFYASTVAAYGYPYEKLPLSEADFAVRPPHQSEFGYAQSKRFALNLLEIMKVQSDTKFVYGLMTNMFGEEDRFLNGNGHVLVSLAEKAKLSKVQNRGLEIWGSPKMTRDFLSTKSTAKIITELVDRDLGILNIGSGHETSIEDIAKIVSAVFELDKGYYFTGDKVGVLNRVSDTTKLQEYSQASRTIDTLSEVHEFYSKMKLLLS
jgi:GDP-L-fucose synthase